MYYLFTRNWKSILIVVCDAAYLRNVLYKLDISLEATTKWFVVAAIGLRRSGSTHMLRISVTW